MTFTQINELSKHIWLTCKRLYSPGTHFVINETIQHFMGCAFEIINIPFKPTPEGFKIWVLANEGYILDFMWHTKGDRKDSVNLNKSFVNKEGFSKTQAVVFDSLLQKCYRQAY